MARGNRLNVRFDVLAITALLISGAAFVCDAKSSASSSSSSSKSSSTLRSLHSSTSSKEPFAAERLLIWDSFWWNWFPSPAPPPAAPAPQPTPTINWNSGWTNWFPSPPSPPVWNPPAPTPPAPVASPIAWPTFSTPVWVPSPVAPPVAAPVSAPTTTTQSSSQTDWLSAHNTRRRSFHTSHSVSFVPLQWSPSLAQSAKQYTNKLLNNFSDCHIQHNYAGDSYGGENLAATYGNNSNHSPEYILSLWYDGEEHLPYPQNGHRTQVAWRATRYVGCYAGSKQLANGLKCTVHTCRYLTPGNCNGPNGILEATTPCQPQCPAEGCS